MWDQPSCRSSFDLFFPPFRFLNPLLLRRHTSITANSDEQFEWVESLFFLSFIFSFSLFYFFGFYKPCDSLIRRWCSRQIQMSRIKRVRIFLLLPPPSSSCLLLFWEIHAFETFMHVQKGFFICLSFFGWGVSFIGWESPINPTGPKRLSRTVARLLMMVEPLWALVKTLFNVCWLSCILGLGLFNLPR